MINNEDLERLFSAPQPLPVDYPMLTIASPNLGRMAEDVNYESFYTKPVVEWKDDQLETNRVHIFAGLWKEIRERGYVDEYKLSYLHNRRMLTSHISIFGPPGENDEQMAELDQECESRDQERPGTD